MRPRFQVGYLPATLLVAGLFILSCATVPDLNVLYRLPPKSKTSSGPAVYLKLEDARAEKDFLRQGALGEFKYFAGNVSFSLAKGSDPGFKIGRYDIPSLIIEGFRKRLEHEGIQVVDKKGQSPIELVILLKAFTLDLQDRRWLTELSYEVHLRKDQKVLAKQMINGQGERYKIIGRKQADAIVGEIFSDCMNKLDVTGLFQQAGL